MIAFVFALIASKAYCLCLTHWNLTSFFMRSARGCINMAHQLIWFLMKLIVLMDSCTLDTAVGGEILSFALTHFLRE